MAFVSIIASRYAIPFEIVSGGALDTLGKIAWSSVSVDYSNDGDPDNPPTRVFVNLSQYSYTGLDSSGSAVVVSLPLSNEAVFVDDGGDETPVGGGDKCSVHWLKRRRFI